MYIHITRTSACMFEFPRLTNVKSVLKTLFKSHMNSCNNAFMTFLGSFKFGLPGLSMEDKNLLAFIKNMS